MAARLVIAESAYALLENHDGARAELASLPRGASALLDPTRPIGERQWEPAIEIAEDWLMPHAARLRGEDFEVEDATGRLTSGLQEAQPALAAAANSAASCHPSAPPGQVDSPGRAASASTRHDTTCARCRFGATVAPSIGEWSARAGIEMLDLVGHPVRAPFIPRTIEEHKCRSGKRLSASPWARP